MYRPGWQVVPETNVQAADARGCGVRDDDAVTGPPWPAAVQQASGGVEERA